MQLYRFDVGKRLAAGAPRGKVAYSHAVRVNFSRRDAIDIMRQLLAQMGHDDGEPLGVTLFGDLAEDPEG